MFCWPSHYLHAHSYSRTLTHIHTVLHVSPSFPAVFPCSTPHVSLSKVLSALSRHTVVVVVSCWAVMLCLASSVWDFQYGESFGKGCVAPTAHTTRSVRLDLSLSLSLSLSVYHVHPHPLFCLASSFLLPSNHCGNSFFFSFCQTKSGGPFESVLCYNTCVSDPKKFFLSLNITRFI